MIDIWAIHGWYTVVWWCGDMMMIRWWYGDSLSATALLRARRVEVLGLVLLSDVWFSCKLSLKGSHKPCSAAARPWPHPTPTRQDGPKTPPRRINFFASCFWCFLDRFFIDFWCQLGFSSLPKIHENPWKIDAKSYPHFGFIFWSIFFDFSIPETSLFIQFIMVLSSF